MRRNGLLVISNDSYKSMTGGPTQDHSTIINHNISHSPLLQRAHPQYSMIRVGGVDAHGNSHTGTIADTGNPTNTDQTVNKPTPLKRTLLDFNEKEEEEMENKDDRNKEEQQEDKMEVFKQPVMKEDLEEYLTHAIRSDLLTNQFQVS